MKYKLLFFVTEFWQAGAQRYAYELDRAIDKTRFQLDILSFRSLKTIPNKEDYYYDKHLELGTRIFFLNDFMQKTFKRKVKNKKLKKFISDYDLIVFMGEYAYIRFIQNYPDFEGKCVIHIQNSKHQVAQNYANYDKRKQYNFISGFYLDELEFELNEFSNFSHYFFPLCFQIGNRQRVINDHGNNEEPKKIAIFTRLTFAKPLDPFIYALQVVKEYVPNVELHFFGAGDPKKEGVYDYVKRLSLEENCFFRGHQEDIIHSALHEKIDLVWLHGYFGVPGGWAGFDICTTKIPQVFWDFSNSSKHKFRKEFPMSNNLIEFVKHSLKILNNPIHAKELADLQYNYVNKYQNINNFIDGLENHYVKIINDEV